MTYQGTVKNGMVVLETETPPPEGAKVEVTVRATDEPQPEESWVDVVLKFAGRGQAMPPDMAAQHDHYIHGTPKR